MSRDDAPGDRQPEAGPPRPGSFVKPIEEPRQRLGRHAFSRVRDRDCDCVSVRSNCQRHRTAGGGVANRVSDQIGEDLSNPERVDVGDSAVARGVYVKEHRAARGFGSHAVCNTMGKQGDIGRLALQWQRAGV